MNIFNFLCKVFGHPKILLLPNPKGIQCGRCLKYKPLKRMVTSEIYAKGNVKNIGQLD